jgi:acetyl esterase/lipase
MMVAASAMAQPRLPGDVEVVRDIQYGTGGGTPLMLDIVRPRKTVDKPMPVLVWIHGGGWRQGNRRGGVPLLVPFAQRGFVCASIEYRLSDVATVPAQIEDCKCAIRFLRAKAKEYIVDPNRIGVWGGSAGGHLAALLGTSGGAKDLEGNGGWQRESSRVQAVCDWFGPTDLTAIAGANPTGNNAVSQLLGGPAGEHKDLAKKASPIAYVSKGDPPFLIMHGDQDRLVPLRQSEVLDTALRKAGVESTYVVVKGKGHGFRGPDVEKPVLEFFERVLKPSR